MCLRTYRGRETEQKEPGRESETLSLPANWRDLGSVASALAQTCKRVTKLTVGNKQQVTQMYTSHVTQLVISLNVWQELYSPSALVTHGLISPSSRAQANTQMRPNAGYQYNTHKWQHAGRIQVNHSHCQLHLRQWKPFGLPSLLSSRNTAPSLRQLLSPIKTIYEKTLCEGH